MYVRYSMTISHRDPGKREKLPVRQRGCVRDASGVKKHSIVARCSEGGERVSWVMMGGSSVTGSFCIRFVSVDLCIFI